MYDQQSRKDPSRNIFAVHKPAEDTFRDVVITTFNDFLDGDIEVVRSMLSKSAFSVYSCHRLLIHSTSRNNEPDEPCV